MAGLGEVKVSLGLDTSKADAQLKSFFGNIGKQQVKDPLKGIDKSFENVAKKAKDLGFAWDSATKSFKNDAGFSATLDQMKKNITNVNSAAKESKTSFSNMASAIKNANDPARLLNGSFGETAPKIKAAGDAAKTATGGFNSLGNSAKTTGGTIKNLVFGKIASDVKNVGTAASGAANPLKNFGTSAKTAGDALKNLNTTGGNGIKQLGTDAGAASTSMGTLATNSKTLGSAFVNLGKQKPLVPIVGSLKSLNGQIPTTTTKFGALGTAIKNAGTGTKFNTVSQQLASLNSPLQKVKSGVDGLKKPFQDSGKEAQGFSSTVTEGFESILKGIPTGIGIAIANQLIAPLKSLAGIIPGAVAEFRALEESISGTLAILGGSAAEFGKLQTSILNVSSATAATAQEVGAVAQSLARAGFSLKEVDQALGPIVKGAEATGTAYENMGNIVVNALGAFTLEAKDAADVADVLTTAANSSNQSVDDLGEALKYVGPVANTTGQSLRDTALGLQLLANAGIKGSQAGTSFRTILTNLQIAASGAGEEFKELSRGSKRLEKALKLIGGNMTDANGELLTGAALIKELQSAFDGLSAGETALVSKALAGAEGLPAMNVLINATGQEVDELAKGLDEASGAADRAANTALSGLSGSFKLLQSNISAFLVQVGSLIATVLKPLVDLATSILSAFNKLPGPIKSVTVALGLLAASVVAVNIAMKTFAGLAGTTFGAQIAAQVTQFVGAFTKANLASVLTGWGAQLGSIAGTLKGAFAAGLAGATKGLTALWTAIKGITWASFTSGISAAAAAIKGGAVAAFTTLKGAVAAAWASLVAAAPAMGAFVAAAAPFVAIGAGVAAIIIAIKRNMDAYKSVADPLAQSQETLNNSLKPIQESAEGNAKAWKSWGDRVADFAGPLGRIVEILFPVTKVMRVLLNLLGEVDRWNRNTAAINAANDAYNEFQRGVEQGNSKIRENMEIIKNGTPGTEAYGRAIAENEKIIRGQSTALGERIKALDATIKKMKEDEGANGAAIQKLEQLRAKYVEQKASVDANKTSIIAMRKETEAITGKTNDYVQAIDDAVQAREEYNTKADAQVYATELQNIADLEAGLISEEIARARNAQNALDIANARIGYANAEVAAIEEAKKRGLINEQQYQEKIEAATGKLQETLKERAQAQKDLTDATKAAIAKRLQELNNEVQQVQQQSQLVAGALNSIFQVQGQSYSALSGLVNELTNLEITKADQVKNKRLKNIDDEEQRRIRAIERSGASDEAKARAKEALEKNFQRQRDAAEREYERKKKAALAEQIRIQNTINQATFAAKQAELGLWYTQQQVQLEIQRVQAEINRANAEAEGNQKAVDAYDKQLDLIGQIQGQLPDMYNLKKDILDIENQTATAALATKAEANGINASYLGSLPTLDSVRQKVGEVKTTTESLAAAWDPYIVRAQDIPDDVDGAVREVKEKIEGINEVTFDGLVESFKRDFGLSTQAAEIEAGKIVTWYDTAGKEAGNIAATNIYERFGDTIPAPLIRDQLIDAFRTGSGLSLKEAEQAYKNLGATIPKDDVVEILGNAFGDGAEDGVEILRNTPIPDSMNIFGGGIRDGMGAQGDEGSKNILQKIVDGTGDAAKAIGNWILYGFEGGDAEVKDFVNRTASEIEDDDRASDALAGNVKTGLEDGSKDGVNNIVDSMEGAAKSGAEKMVSALNERIPQISKNFGDGLERTIGEVASKMKKTLETQLGELNKAFGELAGAVDTKILEEKMRKAVVEPVEDAKQALDQFTINSDIANQTGSISQSLGEVAGLGLGREFRDIATQSRQAASNARSMASSVRSAVGPANSYARAMERAASAAARAARNKWSGGPVEGGTSYTVNELGPEMFMSNSGKLSEIKAPAFGKWRAPSSGTVIPAHVSAQIRQQQEAASVANASIARAGDVSAVSGFDSSGMTGAIAKGFKGVNLGGGSVVNNVQVTSQAPVSDASKILTDLARIRAQRRR